MDGSHGGESHHDDISSTTSRHAPAVMPSRHSQVKSGSVVEVVVDDSDPVREEEHVRHSANKHCVVSSSFGVAPSAMSAASTGRHTQQSGAGFRYLSATHVTYNIKDKGNARQLFVSAPVGSSEAAVHDEVAARAASAASVSTSPEIHLVLQHGSDGL